MEFFSLVKKRHSIREYQKKAVEKEKIRKILEAARSAPSAGNLQAYEIVVVRDPEIKEKLYKAALEQDQILKAALVFVFFANPKRSAVKYGERGAKLYSLLDAAIAASYAQLAMADLSLGVVWVGAFEDEKIKEALFAPKDFVPVAILPAGYPAEEPEKPTRRTMRDLVKWERF